ncbi:MAG TPA: hypothetical protein VH092_02130 [Urbifossiella sp.]|jgi:hypothetical protein|nr:hypothetical protein [Urbifossiella sp.]
MRLCFALVGYFAVLVGGTYLAYQPVFDSGFAVVQSETGDGMLNHYLLEHSWRAVSDPHYPGSLTRPPFYYPEPRVWWYSETLIGAAPMYWALRTGLSDELAYPWWMIVCSALNFVSFAVVARWLGCSHAAAVLGAFYWAFLAVLVDQGKHQQLIPRFWMPPAAYYGWLLGSAPAARALGRMLACLALQGVTCVYSGWFLGVGLAVFVPVAAAVTPGGVGKLLAFGRGDWRAAARAAVPWVLVMAAFFAPYVLVNRGHSRDYGENLELIPTPASWLTPPPGAAWAETARSVLPPVSFECWLFPGMTVASLVCVAGGWACVVRRSPTRPAAWPLVAASLVTAGVWLILCLRLDVVSAWAVVRAVPGGGAIRCVSRVVLVVDLFALLAAAVWLTHALGRVPNRWLRGAAVAVVAVAAVAEQAGHTPLAMRRADFYPAVDRYATALRGGDAGYVVPRPDYRQEYEDVFAMWVGLRAGVPVVNGYSGRHPDGYPLLAPADPDAAVRAWLTGRFRGRVVVINRADPARRREVVVE